MEKIRFAGLIEGIARMSRAVRASGHNSRSVDQIEEMLRRAPLEISNDRC